ncbi:MAG: type II toxin-antitoxin system VapC family toxin [Thermoleophilia bacterium]
MTPVVCDASTVVAMLLDGGPDGAWAARAMRGAPLRAPALLPFEAAEIIRRQEAAGVVSADQAAQAHGDLLDLAVELWPHRLLAERVRELRPVLDAHDASYVALAELLAATLVTLDRRILAAPGTRCAIATPELRRRPP